MTQNDINSLIIIVLLLPLIIGIVLGWQEKTVVFRDYNDLFIVFLAMVLPVPLVFLYSATNSQIMLSFCILAETALIFWIIYRTYQDNQGDLIFALLALYTKIPLSILFLFQLLSLLDSIFKPASRQDKGFSVISLLVLTPLILKFVRNKTGIIKSGKIIVND